MSSRNKKPSKHTPSKMRRKQLFDDLAVFRYLKSCGALKQASGAKTSVRHKS